MKYNLLLLGLFGLMSCSMEQGSEPFQPEEMEEVKEIETTLEVFQSLLDSAGVKGSILVLDLAEGRYYSNDFEWAKQGNLPASTYKITNSIIALETGVLEDDSSMFIWNGEQRRLRRWEQDLSLKNAFHYSCVPCYQEVARSIGVERMNTYLEKLNYGAMDVDSTTIDMFWLEGKSRISQFEQVDFLSRFYRSELPIEERTEMIMKRMMIIEEREDYRLTGKTGWSITNEVDNGWFVGYVESEDKVLVFATNIELAEHGDRNDFGKIRSEVTLRALEKLNRIIE